MTRAQGGPRYLAPGSARKKGKARGREDRGESKKEGAPGQGKKSPERESPREASGQKQKKEAGSKELECQNEGRKRQHQRDELCQPSDD